MAVAKVILNGDTLIDVTRKTVTSETMLSGATALKNDGTDVSGTIITKSSVDVTKNGSEVTIPKGYYSGNIIKAVDGGSAFTPATTITAVPNTSLSTGTGLITITNSKTQDVTPTVTAGYISQGTAGTITVSGSTTLQLTSKAAATYYPSTADQRVSSGRYLTGSQTFKSVITTNLTAENIASGVTVKVGDANNASRILQITGTHQGGIIPTGTYTISSAGLHDVSNYQYASVAAGEAFTPATTITANPTISVNANGLITVTASKTQNVTPIITAGYISTGTSGTITVSGTNTQQLTSVGASTYNTSTADRTIASARYLTGTQTIKSVTTANISAANIKDGVTIKVGDANDDDRIKGVTGTFTDASTVSSGQTAATTSEILEGYSAWVDGAEVQGSFVAPEPEIESLTVTPSSEQQVFDGVTKGALLVNETFTSSKTSATISPALTAGTSYRLIINFENGTGTYTDREFQFAFTPSSSLTDVNVDLGMSMSTSAISITSFGNYGEIQVRVYEETYNQVQYLSLSGGSKTISPALTVGNLYHVDVQLYTSDGRHFSTSTSKNVTISTTAQNLGIIGVAISNSAVTFSSGNYDWAQFYIYEVDAVDGYLPVTVEAMPIGEISMLSEISASSATIDYMNAGVAFSKAITITPQLLSAGYISSVAASTVTVTLRTNMSTQPSYGWIPMSTDRVISSNTYLYGNQTIYGVSHNLSAADIASGKTAKIGWVSAGGLSGNILNVVGTHTGGITPSGTITLSEPGIYDVTSYASAEFSDNRLLRFIQRNWNMQSQTFDTISRIGAGAFAFQTISSIYGQSVTRIENMAFYTAAGLRTVSFPLANYVGFSAFYSCNVLSDVYLPEVTDLYPYAFYSCRSLINIDLPKVTWLQGNVFAACSRLATVSFSQVTLIGGEAFLGCSSLTTANFSVASDIQQNAFSGCKALVNLSFPVLKYIGNAVFSGCTALSSVSFPECIRIGTSAFMSCSNLQNISFPKVTEISAYAFSGCSALTSVDFPLATSMSHGIFKDCTSLTTANFSEATYIAVSMFLNCAALTNISFPVVQTISSNAFTSCSALSFVKFSLVDTISGYAFQYCTSLNTIILGNPNITPTIGIGAYTFSSCSRLLSVYLLYGSMIPLSMVNAFTGTPISNVTTYTGGVYGSIYVPASLYDTYKSATNWKTYSSRFASLTDAQISALLAD